ncbi:MAG: hypothetical protein UT34_C0001G0323 [candidate division WS6 bacterium GW2011_GWF2_39_15]|uniref:Uncharacterized protein n=1 Tax=candidate division WS6 bacterium GW2011_GWF2_39_15 TaxID=1619100 RepID=A0A0G0MT04_9BACT|nr:MAG: hypothetical protein UT34_C0001G0323 [candidate division WS6 bacterium GW2011_GWF2_39_15]
MIIVVYLYTQITYLMATLVEKESDGKMEGIGCIELHLFIG